MSLVQMPGGIPVASMAIDGTKNVALFAVEILALKAENLAQKLKEYRVKIANEVEEKDAKLSRVRVDSY